jgi:RHH-type transcriptional regulator, proline utilization regulon repressor / proline dehydrogenase / delta 1-pyrroline-5-carboxylate dehydrogenase
MSIATPGAGWNDVDGERPRADARAFGELVRGLRAASPLRDAITAATRLPEPEVVTQLLDEARLPARLATAARDCGARLAAGLRAKSGRRRRDGFVQALLQEFPLSSQEGAALMCLAEALLRIPDDATRHALIRDRIGHGNWQAHLGRSPSSLVNTATWGLLLTGRLMAGPPPSGLTAILRPLLARAGVPLVRKAVDRAMRVVGTQFVTGRNMAEALTRTAWREARGFRFSYDMLGEAALTDEDAQRYAAAYAQAIDALGRVAAGRGVIEGPGISIKLSALHPRYQRAQHDRVRDELYPRLLALAEQAFRHGVGFNLDAEEAERLDISLDLLERLCLEPALAGWDGIGFVVQAYQKRCPQVIDYLVDLARRSGHRLMLRLVKGAYWDSEIKRAQVLGLDDYPVFTRKAHTDVCYLACARRMLAAPDALYAQFATHNAHTLAAVHRLAGPDCPADRYEFQCLHGMGEPLYEQVVRARADGGLGRPCRIYAPVGSHATLLAYLVRRLLENGANTSFVHRIEDPQVALDALLAEPVDLIDDLARREGRPGLPHPRIPLPGELYGPERTNSAGLDLNDEQCLASLAAALEAEATGTERAAPWIGGVAETTGPTRSVRNPADRRDLVGIVCEATQEDVVQALRVSVEGAPAWAATPPERRAAILDDAALRVERVMPALMGLLVREAGKTLPDALAEVRETVDFLRYYAAHARQHGRADDRPLGVVACISPWNFPLAIFTGQVAAALAAGNAVVAKPAEQTPLVAVRMVRLLAEAGVPTDALQCLPGAGETVGTALVADARVDGVLFTGSSATAKAIERSLAARAADRPIPLVAETGGINAMIVDSSALPEQVVADVLSSAFGSAGQRCSALRLLCLQQEVAAPVLAMLDGAMAELRIGPPDRLGTDVGPLIDEAARDTIEAYIAARGAEGLRVARHGRIDGSLEHGSFLRPALIELDHPAQLQAEVFGPVLHVLRFARDGLDDLLDAIHASGYGLTMGLHTRIDETVARIAGRARVGNLYVNRNMIGAVVGVQPFGGEGLSGTGPKAGGPLYLGRLCRSAPRQIEAWSRPAAAGRDAARHREVRLAALGRLADWAAETGRQSLAVLCGRFAAVSPLGVTRLLPGPTGERNTWTLHPRDGVLCLADNETDLLTQFAAVLATGSRAAWPAEGVAADMLRRLPEGLCCCVEPLVDWCDGAARYAVALHHGDAGQLREACRALAAREGPVVPVVAMARGDTAVPLERLLVERTLSINTAAAGGNASLMSLD